MAHSTSVLNRGEGVLDEPAVRDLLVLWQHPLSRQIIPVGRFARIGSQYSFRYSHGAASARDFRPLPGLPDLYSTYESDRIPAVFAERVMAPERPDYVQYLDSIGLTPEIASPWEQITRSGGQRAGDTLQFMEVPRVDDGRARARFLTSGIRHVPGVSRRLAGREVQVSAQRHERAMAALVPGDQLRVVAEEDNPEDRSACMVLAGDVPLGWIPRVLAADVRDLLRSAPLAVTVARVRGPGTPSHIRLVVELDVPTPEGFRFDRDGRWEPLVAQ